MDKYGYIYTLYTPCTGSSVVGSLKNWNLSCSNSAHTLYTCIQVPFLSQTDEQGILEVHCNLQVKEKWTQIHVPCTTLITIVQLMAFHGMRPNIESFNTCTDQCPAVYREHQPKVRQTCCTGSCDWWKAHNVLVVDKNSKLATIKCDMKLGIII